MDVVFCEFQANISMPAISVATKTIQNNSGNVAHHLEAPPRHLSQFSKDPPKLPGDNEWG